MATIRVVIADDSSLARGLLRDILHGEGGIEVVGEAADGRQAVELARTLQPDLMTIDLEMPVMGGLQAIEEIMCSRALPILVVSGAADAQQALEAVRRGALEVVGKPDYTQAQAADFVAKVRLLAGVSVITHLRPRRAGAPPPATAGLAAPPAAASAAPAVPPLAGADGDPAGRVFAIAASTGGPQALAQILPALPADFPCPVLVAQHIADGFAEGMAQWLDSLCRLPVRLARHGEPLRPGLVQISPSEQHFGVDTSRRVVLQPRGDADLYRPSCDRLLDSVAAVYGARAVGIILSGMGSDGAQGMASIRARGGATLAQDEASSVIYGMNRVAVERGAVQRRLPLEAIAAEMLRLAATPPGDPA